MSKNSRRKKRLARGQGRPWKTGRERRAERRADTMANAFQEAFANRAAMFRRMSWTVAELQSFSDAYLNGLDATEEMKKFAIDTNLSGNHPGGAP